MTTYDVTGTGSSAGFPFDASKRLKILSRSVKASEIIAANATLTANSKITSGDVLQIIKLPADFIVIGSCIKAITAEGSVTAADLGVGGGDELQDGASLNEDSPSVELTLIGDDWGPTNLTGYGIETADTIDLTAGADIEAGEWLIFVWGIDVAIYE